MERTQFTFYDSFRRAAQRIKNKAHRCAFYDVLADYALSETEPDLDSLPDSVAIAFELIKPNLDAGRRKANSGQKGGKSKHDESKPEANGEQDETKKENKKKDKKENKDKIEDKCPPKSPFSVVLAAYANKINPTPSEMALAELKHFVDDMGAECCLRAIDIALDEKKTSWSYIRAILKSRNDQGVKCIADWDRVDAQREAQKAAKSSRNAGWEPGKPRESSASEAAQTREDMDRMRRMLESMKEEQ